MLWHVSAKYGQSSVGHSLYLLLAGVVPGAMTQAPTPAGSGSSITFPVEPEDPRMSAHYDQSGAGGGLWGFFKVGLNNVIPVTLLVSLL